MNNKQFKFLLYITLYIFTSCGAKEEVIIESLEILWLKKFLANGI